MNNAALHTTARLAELHRADVTREVQQARIARIARRTRPTAEPAATEVPAPRRGTWTRWLPAPRPATDAARP